MLISTNVVEKDPFVKTNKKWKIYTEQLKLPSRTIILFSQISFGKPVKKEEKRCIWFYLLEWSVATPAN